MPECSTAENLGLFFLWMVTHPSGTKNLLLLELFSSVSLDDLFTKPQAFVAKPSHRVLSWIKTRLHHSCFHQLTLKAHPKGYKNCTCGKGGERTLTCPCPAFSAWMRFCYLCDCFHGISDGTGYSDMRFSEADVLLETLSLPLTRTKTHTHTHTHKRNVRAQWKKTEQQDRISLPALNLTFEPNVYWYFWQVW